MLIEIVVRLLGRTYLNLSLDLSQARIPNNEIKQILEAIGKRSNCCAANYLQLLKSDYPQLNKEKSEGLFKI